MTETPQPSSAVVHPHPVIDRLPAYAAGKPPVAVPGLQPYKLSSNENPFAPVAAVREVIGQVVAGEGHTASPVCRYPDPLSTQLRERLAEHLDVPAEDIVTGAGSLGALTQIINAFAGGHENGGPDEVIYAWRSFEAYPIVVRTAGAQDVPVPLTAEHRHDLPAMLEAITERTRVIVLCTPNNPTGPVLHTDEVEEFIAQVPGHVLIVIDEAYVEFIRDADAVKGLEMYRKHPNVAVLRTFSKAHGLANLRVGYSVAGPQITQYLRRVATPFAVSTLAEQAAVASLDHLDEVDAAVQTVVDERERVAAALRETGWDIPETQANFVWLPLGERAAEFAAAAGERALSVRAFPGEGVRVSIGEVEANDRFLDVARAFLQG
ncbi:MAG: histidinol-phosphate transaminase [Micrococcus sp.]|nr:histidinol-phosphate transaminase [Micrococcus sp.]